MGRPPRDAEAWILDGPSLRFVAMAGGAKGALGLLVLFLGPLVGLSLAATQAVVFHYHAIAKLMTALPARRVASRPLPNVVLVGSIALGLGLQALILAFDRVAATLEVATIDGATLFGVLACVAASWLFAELSAGVVTARSR
jgi:hypothetical protein